MKSGKPGALALASFSVLTWLIFAAGVEAEPADRPMVIFIWAICIAALLAGLFSRLKTSIIAASLMLPPLVLAIWTAPRGDNDGLWVLIFPMLLFFGAVCYGLAAMGANIKKRY